MCRGGSAECGGSFSTSRFHGASNGGGLMLDKSHKLAVDAAKGDKARAKLEDQTFKDAMAQLEADYIKAWKSTGMNDATAREKLYLAVKMLDQFESHLVNVMNDGKLARSQIELMSRNKAA
jgi:hypothetical protein